MTLTTIQTHNLLMGHCYRVIENMNHDDLINYAVQMMAESFDKNPGMGDTDIPMLVSDIMTAEDEDEDSAHKFIMEALNDDAEAADQLMADCGISPWAELVCAT
jgi:hypothetical protein